MNKTTQLTNDINRLHYVLDLLDFDNPSGATITDALKGTIINTETLTRTTHYLCGEINQVTIKTPKNQVA